MYNAQQDSHSSWQQQQQQQYPAADSVVVAGARTQQQQQQVIPLQDIEMNLEHVSLSLRLTCEMNRRLLQGIRSNDNSAVQQQHNNNNNNNSHDANTAHNHHNPLLQRGGDNSYHPVHVHPSQLWQRPIKSHSDEEQEEVLTIFHAKSPRNKARRGGAARWGPELLPYLHYLVEDVLKLPENKNQRSLILVLTLLYLDRACSVETPRTTTTTTTTTTVGQQQQPCPFLQPRTVHRLVLTSLLIATRTVVVDEEVDTSGIETLLGIPSLSLQQMESQFHNALGDFGLFVDPLRLQQWMMQWQDKFAKRRAAYYY
jgi:hypothetical protein